MLLIKKEIIDGMVKHAQKDAPIEACGYLAEKDGIVLRQFPMTNTDSDSDHFSLDPKEQFAVIKEARTEGLRVAGIYHSHPVTPARPSEEDIKLAFDPNMSYVIVSLVGGAEDVKSFKIVDGRVENETIEVIV